jgi:hypothetical protein
MLVIEEKRREYAHAPPKSAVGRTRPVASFREKEAHLP